MRISSGLCTLVAFISATYAQSCTPSNCNVVCSPTCSSTEMCIMGTMVTCGECPASKCIARTSVPSANGNQPTQSSSNGGLIGGIVGGILAGGVLLCVLGFFFMKKRQKKHNLPIAFRSRLNMHDDLYTPPTPFNTLNEKEVSQQTRINSTESAEAQSRQVLSGVIPVTFIPHNESRPGSEYTLNTQPSERDSRYTLSTQVNDHLSPYTSCATFGRNSWKTDNPFDDRHSATIRESVAESVMSQNYLSTGRRDSMESNISQQQTAKVAQATQVTRAKPQIMRVNTVRVADSLTRSGSIKSIKPQVEIHKKDPFDDVYRAEKKPTDSVMSAPGDGEITIFWNGT